MPNSPAPPENGNGGGPMGFLTRMVNFFDNHFGSFSKTAQNATVAVFLFVFATVALNTLIAPTFIEGKIYVIDEKDPNPIRVPAYNYRVSIGDHADTPLRGVKRTWRLPLYRSIPKYHTITIELPPPDLIYAGNMPDQNVGIAGDISIFAPIPIYSALIQPQYTILVYKRKNGTYHAEKEIAFNINGPGLRDLEIALDGFLKPASAEITPLNPRKNQYVPREASIRRVADAFIEGGYLPPEGTVSIPAYLLKLESITVGDIKSWVFSSTDVAFNIKVDGRLLNYINIVGGSKVTFRSEQFSWVYGVGDQTTAVPVGFPVPQIRSTWIPVSEGETRWYGDIHANLTSAVSLSTTTDDATTKLEVQPAGRVILEMTKRRHSKEPPLARFDITEAIKKPGMINSITSDDGSATVTIKFIPAWLVGFDLPPYISVVKCFENTDKANDFTKIIHEVDSRLLAEVYKTDDVKLCGRNFREKKNAYRVVITGAKKSYHPSQLYDMLKQHYENKDILFAPVGLDYRHGSPVTIKWDY